MTMAIASLILLFVASTFAALSFGSMWALWPDLETMALRRFAVASMLYVLILVGSWIYTDRKERRLNPRYQIRWDTKAFVLVALPFLLFRLARHAPENLLLIGLFLVLLQAFYGAVKAQQEVAHEEEKIGMTVPTSRW